MDRTPVTSSNLASIGYDPAVQILQVEFNNGRVYNYFRVPPDKFEAIMAADSCGKYLNAEIKPNHQVEEVRLDDAAHYLAMNQQQLDADGVIVGVSRQALNKVGNELHFLRYFYEQAGQAFGPADGDVHAGIVEMYEDRHGWQAPSGYRHWIETEE